jgi:hypothetical protein
VKTPGFAFSLVATIGLVVYIYVYSQPASQVRFRGKLRDNLIVWRGAHDKVIMRFFHYILLCWPRAGWKGGEMSPQFPVNLRPP